MIYRAPSWPV